LKPCDNGTSAQVSSSIHPYLKAHAQPWIPKLVGDTEYSRNCMWEPSLCPWPSRNEQKQMMKQLRTRESLVCKFSTIFAAVLKDSTLSLTKPGTQITVTCTSLLTAIHNFDHDLPDSLRKSWLAHRAPPAYEGSSNKSLCKTNYVSSEQIVGVTNISQKFPSLPILQQSIRSNT
jgi:hypothetical protein